MTESTDRIASLHARVVDAREGYQEGSDLAEKPEMVELFRELRDLHDRHAQALAAALTRQGIVPDDDGSFLQYVHKAVLNVRSALTGLGENVIPGLRDGEQRILEDYDDTLSAVTEPELRRLLEEQRAEVASRVRTLELMERHADA